jgi:uncharacterized membrane protein YidH (DUF202 family)
MNDQDRSPRHGDGTRRLSRLLSRWMSAVLIAAAFAATPTSAFAAPEESADSGSSSFVGLAIPIVIVLLLVVGAVVFGKRIIAVHDRRTLPWLDGWLKSGVIVVGMILVTTIVPARVIESGAVRDLSREVQDLITLGVWSVGLFGGLWVLWWAHRESRI